MGKITIELHINGLSAGQLQRASIGFTILDMEGETPMAEKIQSDDNSIITFNYTRTIVQIEVDEDFINKLAYSVLQFQLYEFTEVQQVKKVDTKKPGPTASQPTGKGKSAAAAKEIAQIQQAVPT
ncbi:MAG: hypothetical protein EZS28_025465, partial [Streblomastix strix]